MKHFITFLSNVCLFTGGCLMAGCMSQSQQYDTALLWSDKPAYTCMFSTEEDYHLTSDIYDNVWEGDAVPEMPRVANPKQHKRWLTGEGHDYLDDETFAATGGNYNNPNRIWEGEPYPMANGRIAASVFHGSGRDRYGLNEVSFWSGGRNGGTINNKGDKSFNGEHGPETTDDGFGGSQPVGDFVVDFGAPVKKGSFIRKIVMDRGELVSSGERKGVRVTSTSFISYPDQMMVLHYRANQSKGLNCSLSFATNRTNDSITSTTNSLQLTSELANGMRCVALAHVDVYGGVLKHSTKSVQVVEADSFTVRMAVETNYKMDYHASWRGEEPEVRVAQRMKAASNYSFDQLRLRHQEDFGGLYSRAALKLPEAPDSLQRMPIPERLAHYQQSPTDTGLEEILFNYGRYLMISTSRPGQLPAGLQGIWNGMSPAPWGNDYHSNINFQMVYWLAEQANLSECHLAMIDYLKAMREPNRLATQEFLQATGQHRDETGGWLVYTSHNPFGGHGWQVNLPGSAWYGLHLWEHFAFTQDTTYLRTTAYPMLRELSMFWEKRLKELGEGAKGFVSNYKPVDISLYPELKKVKAGTLVVPEGWSPEHGPRGEDGVSHDQEIIAELFKHTLEAGEILKEDSLWRVSLLEKTKRLYRPQIGKKGNLMEWMIDRDPETDHRHTSHLFAVYPGSQITFEETPELAEAARVALLMRKNTGDSRRGWAWSWRAMLWSRLHDGNRAHEMVQGLLSYNMLNNMLASHKIPLQIDANYGIAAAMLEMLVQSQNGIIHLLPAVCDAWMNGSIRGVKARGNISVDMEWKNGKVMNWTLYSDKPKRVKVLVNGEEIDADVIVRKRL